MHWARDEYDPARHDDAKDGGRIELVHVKVVDDDFAGVSQGWEKFYWARGVRSSPDHDVEEPSR